MLRTLWNHIAYGADHRHHGPVVKVAHGSYEGWFVVPAETLWTIAHCRCSECGKVFTTEVEGHWTVAELNARE